MTIHQISVFLENRAGQLAEITKVLADNGIDMRAISIAETADYGVLRLIVDQPQKTTATLLEHGFILSMTPVTVVAVPDQPGGLAPVLQLVAEGNIDIEYMYSLFTHTDGQGLYGLPGLRRRKIYSPSGSSTASPPSPARSLELNLKRE